MAKAKTAKRKDEVAVMGGGPYRLEPLPGARNIRTLSARYIADLQDHWERSKATPKTVDEALAELESKVGTKGRRKFEKFLREVAEDEDENVIDVESK